MEFTSPATNGRLWKSKADFFRPFRAAASAQATTRTSKLDSNPAVANQEEPDLRELNSSLAALVDIFPEVQPEVFREMLMTLSDESRLQIVTEHLLQKGAKWIQGRYRPLTGPTVSSSLQTGPPERDVTRRQLKLSRHDLFRRQSYRTAVKQVMYLEFKTLSRSTVKAILAEQNFSYTLARPILQQLAARTWRFTLANLWNRRPPESILIDHPQIIWNADEGNNENQKPVLKSTGDAELDEELEASFITPIVAKQQQDRLEADFAIASDMNEVEASHAGSLFDCECCLSSVSFECIASCNTGQHFLCLDCVRRTVKEGLYGQGWARAVDVEKATVRCFTPSPLGCTGVVPSTLVHRALHHGSANDELWAEFQRRITRDALAKSQSILHRCPFCEYAELAELPQVVIKHPAAILRSITAQPSPTTQVALISCLASITLFAMPLVLIAILIRTVIPTRWLPIPAIMASWARVSRRRRGMKFNCQTPDCAVISCSQCNAPWQDPHVCFESEKSSLRKAVEASATAAVKRTCPKCLLSFVKSSGCNKMVCNCGYTMCYICRLEISSKEGYAHFCQHFRPNGGRCNECDRCDLYGDEDEAVAIRRAAQAAELAWRAKDNRAGIEDTSAQQIIETLNGPVPGEKWYEVCLDRLLDIVTA